MTEGTATAIRVVEFPGGGIAVAYAGWLLARLGAEVHAVVPPAKEGTEALALQSLAEGKLEIKMPASWDELLGSADLLLVERGAELEKAIGPWADIAARFPRLVVAVHSIFGVDGPSADFPAVALDAQAVSGVAWALGDPAREPLTLPPGIVEHQSGAMLAAGALLATMLHEQGRPAERVDIALADVLASFVAGNCRFYIHHGMAWHRSGQRASSSGGAYPYVILPCADGEVCLCGRTRDEWGRLVTVMGNPAWASEPRYKNLRAMGRDYPEEVDSLLRPWLATKTMDELERLAIDNNLIVSPVRSLADVVATPGFADDGFLERRSVCGADLIVPGLPFRAFDQRSNTAQDLTRKLLRTPALAAKAAVAGAGPLSGVRVIDFGWVWSAPWVGTILGELGAEVIKVEHGKRLDNLRLSGRIFRDGVQVEGASTEMSPMFHQVNHGKLGITLNAKEPRAVELIMKLVAGADLVIENMSPGSLERSGLGYEALREVNPRLVMLAMSAAGQFGALAGMRAYAPTMSSFAGMEALIGYPDEEPIGALNVGLADPNASVHGLLAALAGLRRAQATGIGCYLDLSQVEALAGVLRPYLLDAQVQERQPPTTGNRHPTMAPHGIYPARGDDSWLTIAVLDDTQWRELARLAERQEWAVDPRFATTKGRLNYVADVDTVVGSWSRGQDRDGLVERLRAAGIASSPVQGAEEMWRDPHFAARRLGQPIDIPGFGPDLVARAPWRFSGFQPTVSRAGPELGEHNRHVFGGLLGLDNNEIERLIEDGVIA